MKLIVMAHRGEAQNFISALRLKPIDDKGYFYQGTNTYLLISGEGIYNVYKRLAYILGKYEITSILNLGIAGALTKTLKLMQIYPIRTCYHYKEIGPSFHSYTTDNDSKLDCITSDSRVLSDDQARALSMHAQITDRELWAIASVASEYKVPLTSFKLISDYAGSQTECFDLKNKAIEFSQAMFNFYQTLESGAQASESTDSLSLPFRASFSQRTMAYKLLARLEINTEEELGLFCKKYDISKIEDLLLELDQIVNPFKKIITQKLDKCFLPLRERNIKIHTDPKFEKKKYNLSMEVNSQKNLDDLKEALENTKYSDFETIWDGGFDV